MEIRHRFGKSHANADTLSRLQTADPVPVTPEQTRQLCTDTKGGLTPTNVFCLPIHSEELLRLTGVFGPRLASPIWFNFAKDFLIFDGEEARLYLYNFIDLGTKNKNKRQAEQRMTHRELRDLAFGTMKDYG